MQPLAPTTPGRVRRVAPVLAFAALLAVLGQQVVGDGPLTRLDRAVERALVPHRANLLVDLARLLTELGNAALVVPLLAAVAGHRGLRERSWRAPARLAVLTVALGGSVVALKAAVDRPSAHGLHGGTWPSGHAATAVVGWGLLALLLHLSPRRARALGIGIPLLVGGCLVLAGRHQVGDVLAGWALGGLLLAVDRALDGDPGGGVRERGGPPPARTTLPPVRPS